MTAITTLMTAEAEAASQRYSLLVDSWRSLYGRALDRLDFGTPAQIDRLISEAYGIGRAFMDSEYEEVARASHAIALEARTATLNELRSQDSDALTDEALAHLSDAEDYLRHELSVQIERDIAFLKQSIRKAILQVNISAKARQVPLKTAMIEYRVGNSAELHFFFHDRGGQKWPSRKFVRAVWRLHLLSLYNEVVLMTLADHGLDQAQVEHVNPKATSHGMIVSIASNSKYPIYSEIRNEVFHPNADAILRRAGDVPR